MQLRIVRDASCYVTTNGWFCANAIDLILLYYIAAELTACNAIRKGTNTLPSVPISSFQTCSGIPKFLTMTKNILLTKPTGDECEIFQIQ